MHPFLSIPLVTLVCSCIVGSGTVARDRHYRPNRVVVAAMLCTGGWALLELAYSIQADAASALRLIRLLGFAYLPLAPLLLELLLRLDVFEGDLYRRLRVPLWTGIAALAVAHAATPWFIASVSPAPSGWRYHFGPAFWPGLLATLTACGLCSVRMMRSSSSERADAQHLRWLGATLWLPIAFAGVTDVLLPALAIDGPRLGAASIALSVGAAWLGLFAGSSPGLASSALARRFLDRLPDGVAILRLDGTLRAANERLPRILGRKIEDLLGRPVSEWLGSDEPAALRELRERQVETPRGPVPVALWTSEIVDRRGEAIGRILVVREQRALVELRRQEVASGQMSALGALAAGIAHEVNNPIAYVLANLNQLRRHREEIAKALPDAPAVAGAAGPIDASAACLEPLVDFVAEVRSFAHPGSSTAVSCRVERVVEGALRLAAPKLRGRHDVTLESGESCELRCSPQELKHALLCLLLCVGRELEAPGSLCVRTRRTPHGVDVEMETSRPLASDAWTEGAELLIAPDPAPRRAGLLVPRTLLRQQGGSLAVEPTASGGTRLRVSLHARDEAASVSAGIST